jgi:hypothetical protein
MTHKTPNEVQRMSTLSPFADSFIDVPVLIAHLDVNPRGSFERSGAKRSSRRREVKPPSLKGGVC